MLVVPSLARQGVAGSLFLVSRFFKWFMASTYWLKWWFGGFARALPCPEIGLKWDLFLFRVFWGGFEAQSRLFLGFAETSFAYHPQEGQDVPGNKSILNVKRQKKNKNPIFSNR